MRSIFVGCLLAALVASGCDVKSIILAKDPLKVRAEERVRRRSLQANSPEPPTLHDPQVRTASAASRPPASPSYRRTKVPRLEMAEIMALAEYNKQLVLQFDSAKLADQAYPPLVEAIGGRDQLIRILDAQQAELEAQGVVIESIDLSQPDEMHIGQSFRLCFVPVRVHGKAFDIRCQVDIYFIAFARNGTEDWYLLHGGNITPDMFHTILPGFPPTLEFPEIRRTVFED